MTDLSEMRTLSRARGASCWYQAATITMQAEDLAVLRAGIDDTTISAATISRWLRTRGIKVGGNSISRHRRSDCACGHE